MRIKDMIDTVIRTGDEQFFPAKSKAQAELMRVGAFNIRRHVPEILREEIGIQKVEENGRWFLRIYKKELDELVLWVRGADGKLAPALVTVENNPEIQRMISMMRKDKKTEEEIAEAIKGM